MAISAMLRTRVSVSPFTISSNLIDISESPKHVLRRLTERDIVRAHCAALNLTPFFGCVSEIEISGRIGGLSFRTLRRISSISRAQHASAVSDAYSTVNDSVQKRLT
jgi:hypothetical protein